jgi:hypothetical protein
LRPRRRRPEWTYKKVKGYQPILAFLTEAPLCLAYEFREGNVSAGAQALNFLKKCTQVLPAGKKITHLKK